MTQADELNSLREMWERGNHEEFIARRLLYLLWSSEVEPPFVTGIGEVPGFAQLIAEVLGEIPPPTDADFETALVVGYMVWFAPWGFRSEADWEPRALQYLTAAFDDAQRQNRTQNELCLIRSFLRAAMGNARNKHPSSAGCFPDLFQGCGAYERYFAWIFGCRDETGTVPEQGDR